MNQLSGVELLRYSRQIAIDEIGREGQIRLRTSKVLVIGCGALGSMIAMQLAGAGIGKIGIADFDNVDISNLQRQFFFTTAEAGNPKVTVLGEKIKALNPSIGVEEYHSMITPAKAEKLIPLYDFIVDATDNPESKRMIGELALKNKKGCCIGGVKDFSGQVMTLVGDSCVFEDYFGNASADGVLPCSLGGVLGPAAALCASIQASETIKYLIRSPYSKNQLTVFNLLTNSFQEFDM